MQMNRVRENRKLNVSILLVLSDDLVPYDFLGLNRRSLIGAPPDNKTRQSFNQLSTGGGGGEEQQLVKVSFSFCVYPIRIPRET